MAQWVRLQLGHGSYGGRRLISDSAVEEMHTPQIVVRMSKDARETFPDAHFMAYGLAWFLRDFHGKKFVGHGGAIDGMRAEVGLIPEARLGVVVLCNLGGTSFPVAIMHRDRKSTRLNSSHSQISYAVFCLKKKNHRHSNFIVFQLQGAASHCQVFYGHNSTIRRERFLQSILQCTLPVLCGSICATAATPKD